MDRNDLVSVITPTYKSKEFIMETIQSVINQTYTNWELIVIDDASNDQIEDYIYSKISDKRVKVITKDTNEGAARARNDAIKISSGRYLAFLDSDDVWEKNKLSEQIKFMKEQQYAFTFTSYRIVDQNSKKFIVNVPQSIDYEGFLKNTIIGTSTVILDRDKINNCYLVDVRQDHDSMTWLRIMRENKIRAYGISTVLTNYYKRDTSISNDKLKAARVHWKNLRKYENLSFLRTSYVFFNYSLRAFIKHFIIKEEKYS